MEDALRHFFIPAIALLALSSSCSWYKDMQRSLVEDDSRKAKNVRSVPREQYDQLLVKYEELSKKYEKLKENPSGSQSLVEEVQNTRTENFGSNVETVDVFSSQTSASTTPVDVPQDIDAQLDLFKKGMSLKATDAGEATKIFQQLEAKGVPAVKTRAKLQVGEILFSKEQYDLALQVFEDIINKNSQSGVVLDALKFAVVCSEKLGIQNKKDQYASMLTDVFETN